MHSFICELASTRATLATLSYQFLGFLPTATISPKIDGALGTEIFPHPVLGPFITRAEHGMLIKFLKIKPPTFVGSGMEDTFELIVDYYERFHKIGIVELIFASIDIG